MYSIAAAHVIHRVNRRRWGKQEVTLRLRIAGSQRKSIVLSRNSDPCVRRLPLDIAWNWRKRQAFSQLRPSSVY